MLDQTLLEITKNLVSFDTDSITKRNNPNKLPNMIDYIVSLCRNSGFEVEMLSSGKRTNIIATKGPTDLMSSVALSGHMDTVAPSSGWDNPRDLILNDGKYQALGIADMKLFLAIMLRVGKIISSSELTSPFSLYFTSDEEIGCLGAKDLMNLAHNNKFTPAKNIIIGEPTEMIPINMHKGYIYFSVKIRTPKELKSAHSSDTYHKTNIIQDALPTVIIFINEFISKISQFKDTNFSPPYATMNIGKIVCSDNAAKNVIPREVTIEGDIRPIPGQDIMIIKDLFVAVLKQAEETINSNLAHDPVSIIFRFERNPTPPMATPESSILLEAVRTAGISNKARSVPYNTEGGIFSLNRQSEVIILGPGSIKQAHTKNEFVDKKYLDESIVSKYVQLIRYFCCKGD